MLQIATHFHYKSQLFILRSQSLKTDYPSTSYIYQQCLLYGTLYLASDPLSWEIQHPFQTPSDATYQIENIKWHNYKNASSSRKFEPNKWHNWEHGWTRMHQFWENLMDHGDILSHPNHIHSNLKCDDDMRTDSSLWQTLSLMLMILYFTLGI